MRWLIAGGGTGGHVTPALALGEVIRDAGDEILFVGSDRGLERDLVPREGFELVTLPSRQVMGRGPLARAGGVVALLGAAVRARAVLARYRPDLVVSVGGYAALPAVAAAALRRTPIALLEPNARPGRVNRLTARWARGIFVAFDDAAAAFGGGPRVQNLGIPLRRNLVEAFAKQASDAGGRPGPDAGSREAGALRLLVFGGSQGARQLNEAMMEAAPELAALPLEVFHQTGEADRERVAGAYQAARLRARVVAFEHDMPARYAWADVALCRAGALTVAELALAGLPALLVPYPYAADDHQAANARELEAAGAARLLDARAFDATVLRSELARLLGSRERLAEMSSAAASRARPDAAGRMVEACRTLLGGGATGETAS